MQTDLNKKVSDFFSKYKLEDITSDNIKKHFNNIKETNNYGNILHAIVHNKYDENKALKTIELLLILGVDANYRAEVTGYSFIHLALYGYTIQDTDESYSTEFILNIIELAKKYHLNVNIKDNDLDTIIHTSIASEIYSGKIIPLIKALGTSFDLESKDKLNNNIYEALLYYKDQAQIEKNDAWFQRLDAEEKGIEIIVKKTTLEDVEKKLKKLLTEFKELLNQLSLININQSQIIYIKILSEYNDLLKQRLYFTNKPYPNKSIKELFKMQVQLLVKESLNQLKINPNRKEIVNLEQIINNYDLKEELVNLQEIKRCYEEHIGILLEQITKSDNILKLDEIEQKINNLSNDEIKIELNEKVLLKKQSFMDLLNKIDHLKLTINVLQEWILQNNITLNFTFSENETLDLRILNLNELEQHFQSQINIFNKLKAIIENYICTLTNNFITLIENNIFQKDELLNFFISSLQPTDIKLAKKI